MNKISLFIASVALGFSCASAQAQDFTVSEMMQLRTSSLSNFETVVMGKGYILNDVDKEYDHYVTFKKGHSTISWGYVKSDRYIQDVDTVIIYIMTDENDYDKLKASVKDNKSWTQVYKNETHILHVNMGGDVMALFRTKFNERPLYEVEVTTVEDDRFCKE